MRISYRPDENVLRLTLDQETGDVVNQRAFDGVIDIAEQGRLVGIELSDGETDLPAMFSPWVRDAVASRYVELDDAGAYVALSAPSESIPEQHIRSASLQLIAELDRGDQLVAIAIPRRGHGYEISFPSGNQ